MPTVAPATPGGPNRLARKEEARRQREVVRRRMARRRQLRVVGVVVAVLLVAGGITTYFVTRPSPAVAAGCGQVRVIQPYPGNNDRAHIGGGQVNSPPPLSSYRSTPPASGPHNPTPMPAGQQMVLVAWHHVQDCTRISLAAVQSFVSHYRLTTGERSAPGYQGDAPEPGVAI